MINIKQKTVICCGEFYEAIWVAKKLAENGFAMINSGENPYEWLKGAFGKQFGICLVVYPNKEVAWCQAIDAVFSGLPKMDAIDFLKE